MVSLFRRSSDDLGLLRSTVESLGATSVPGLAAALAWRERRTERALVEELARPGTPLTYDPALRVVRWAPPIEEAPARPPSRTLRHHRSVRRTLLPPSAPPSRPPGRN